MQTALDMTRTHLVDWLICNGFMASEVERMKNDSREALAEINNCDKKTKVTRHRQIKAKHADALLTGNPPDTDISSNLIVSRLWPWIILFLQYLDHGSCSAPLSADDAVSGIALILQSSTGVVTK